jgi:hypothetical protein
MTLVFRPWTAAAGCILVTLACVGCGGEAETPAEPTNPSPVAAAPTPAPTPVPTPTPDPNPLGLASGPVASVKAYIKQVESPTRGSGQFREVQKNANDEFVFYVGEFVVLDSTQRNAAGQICRWKRAPYYSWDNFDGMMDIRNSDDPFFFKFAAARPGYAEVVSVIDGVESNVLKLRGVRP